MLPTERHMLRHAKKDREAGGPGLGTLRTRKRSWLDNDERVTTRRPTTPEAATASAPTGPEEGKSQTFSSDEDPACGTGGDGETSSAGLIPPQFRMGSLTQEEKRNTHDGRPESGASGALSQFQLQGDPQEQAAFLNENFQLSPPLPSQAYGMDRLTADTAGMSLAEYQACYWESLSPSTTSCFDTPFTTLNSNSRLLEKLPGYFLGDQKQSIAISSKPIYAANVAGDSRLLGVPASKEFLKLGIKGPMAQDQMFPHQVLQSLQGALEQNPALLGEGGLRQCKSCSSLPEAAQAISLDTPSVSFRTGTAASPNDQPPDLGSPWAFPTPHTQYQTTSTLGYTRFGECAPTATPLPQPPPTTSASPLPNIDEVTWREVLSPITRPQPTLLPASLG